MIKNFVYLDIEKLNSLSSQVFEGVTEYVLNESSKELEDSESQKGPVGSGRVLGDILRQGEKTSEKMFLNDYSYTLFEKKLVEDRLVSVLYSNNEPNSSDEAIDGKSFLKVKAKVVFNDINSINDTLANFNKIGKALAHLTSFQQINEVKKQLEKAKASTKDRNQKSKLQAQVKDMTNINKIAKEKGLHQDQAFLDDLALVLTYGFQDQLEIQMDVGGFRFAANLKRGCLREDENLIIRKYSRQTEVEFVLFGVVTQHQGSSDEDTENKEEYESIKEALMNLVSHLTNVESTFTGRLSNEIIIDPIALYTEL